MSDEKKTEFKISQDYELLLPMKQKAYPISKDEWRFLKEKILKVKDSSKIYNTIGSILFGVTGSTLLSVISYGLPPNPITIDYIFRAVITIGIMLVSSICGICFLFFDKKQKSLQKISTDEIIRHMELIEKRYEIINSEMNSEN